MRTLVIFILMVGAAFGQSQLAPLKLDDPDADRVLWWDDSETRLDWAIPAELRAWLDLEIGTDVMRFDTDLDDLADGSLSAAKVGVADAGGNFDATNVETVLAEIAGGVIGGGDAISIDGGATVDPNLTSDRDIAFFDEGGGDWSLYIKAGTILLADLSATLQGQLTLDTEWDLASEINAKTTDEDFLLESDIGSAVQAWSAVLDGTTASFLIADETKLDGIEAGADVTDATNVLAALAANASPVDLNGQNVTNVGTVDGRDVSADGALVDTALQPADVGTAAAADLLDDDTFATATSDTTASSESIKAYVDAEVAGATGTGDSVLIDGANTTDPDFVSTGDIDFSNAANTITANIKAGVVALADLETSIQDSLVLADSAIQSADIDSAAKINTLTTDEDFLVDSDIGVTAQAYDADLDDLADGTLSAAKIDAAITRDTEWDSAAKINTATTDNDFLIDSTGTVDAANINWTDVTLADFEGAQVAPAISFNFGSAASFTLPPATVTLANMANLAQDQFIGRTTASTGVPQTATITSAARTVLDDTSVGNMVNTLGGATATGTGGLVRATSPTLVTPALGTPSALTLTNATGLPTAGLVDAAVTLTKLAAAVQTSLGLADSATQPTDFDTFAELDALVADVTLLNTTNIETEGPYDLDVNEISVAEKATAATPVAGRGEYWVRTDNTPMFTDEAGVNHELNAAAGGSGDVTAASAFGTDNLLIRSDGTGKGVQASGITIDDSNNVSGVATMTATSFSGSGASLTNLPESDTWIIACSDETTALTTGTAKVTFLAPYAATITAIHASVNTAPTGSNVIIDVNEAGTTLMTTNKTFIEPSETSSYTSPTFGGITDPNVAAQGVITIDIDQVGSTVAGAGLKVYIKHTH